MPIYCDHYIVVSDEEGTPRSRTVGIFMITQISKSDKYDCKNLKRGLAWLKDVI